MTFEFFLSTGSVSRSADVGLPLILGCVVTKASDIHKTPSFFHICRHSPRVACARVIVAKLGAAHVNCQKCLLLPIAVRKTSGDRTENSKCPIVFFFADDERRITPRGRAKCLSQSAGTVLR